jgi:integrase
VCEFKEPKTAHSRRHVRMTRKLAAFLRQYEQDRKALYRESGKDLSLDDLVFANADGRPLAPSVPSHDFGRYAKRASLKGVRFHDLRHTFASPMLLRGVPAKVISEALGYATAAFTMDTYSHIMAGMQSDAMALLDEVLPAAKNGTAGIYAKS